MIWISTDIFSILKKKDNMKSAVLCDGRSPNQTCICNTGNKNLVFVFFEWC